VTIIISFVWKAREANIGETLLNKNIEVDVHYQVTNLFQETALEVFQEMQNGRFHETTAFLPFVSSVKKEIIKTIANMDGVRSSWPRCSGLWKRRCLFV
jgi:hypothetical protein